MRKVVATSGKNGQGVSLTPYQFLFFKTRKDYHFEFVNYGREHYAPGHNPLRQIMSPSSTARIAVFVVFRLSRDE